MPIPFSPPEGIIAQYLNRPNPIQEGLDATNRFAQTYLAMKQQQKQQQNEALGQYVKAFEAGGPQFAQDVGKRAGLINPPALPGMTATMAGPGGTAGVMSNRQPSMAPPAMPPAAPPMGQPSPDFVTTPNELNARMSLPSDQPQAQPMSSMSSPIVAHWNNTMGGGQQAPAAPAIPSPAAPATAPAAPAAQPPQGPAGVPGLQNPEQYLNMGKYGMGQLQAGEALGKYKDAMSTAYEKDVANSPRSANQLRQDFTLAGQPDKADAWMQAHAPKALDNPDQPLINTAQIKEAKDWLTTGAQASRGTAFESNAAMTRIKTRQALVDDARKTLDPMFQTGEGRSQMQRLNNVGRTEALVTQMAGQKDGGNPMQMRELGTRMDSVLRGSPNGQQAIEGINALVPDTARGNWAKIAEWYTNKPQGTDQQAFIKLMSDTVAREKGTIQSQVKQTMARAETSLGPLRDNYPGDYKHLVTPYMTGKYGELTGPPTISSDAEFNALPSGAQFKDPSGQTHTKN